MHLQACKSLTELTPGSRQKVILLKSNSWKSIPLMKTNLVRFLLNDGESFSGTIFFFFGLSLVRIPQTIFFRTFLLTGFACSILFLSLGSAAKAIFNHLVANHIKLIFASIQICFTKFTGMVGTHFAVIFQKGHCRVRVSVDTEKTYLLTLVTITTGS